jgi:uncharacterized membrane protein YdjX (TVP38/TMEM64 family)
MRFWGPAPNCVQNYMFGLTGIVLLPYSLITLVFTLPQLALYTYVGASGRAILIEGGDLHFAAADRLCGDRHRGHRLFSFATNTRDPYL